MTYKGNKEILNGNRTAFLCSRRIPADIVLKSYDWAKVQREQGNCVVCGNQSRIEKDVFDILLRGNQNLILVIARGMKTRWEPEIDKAVREDRLLIISPFSSAVKRVSRDTAKKRNQEIITISDRITVGYITPGGQLDELLDDVEIVGV